jgi:glucose/arabinose dehydrogenase
VAATTAKTLLSVDQPASNHNGGWLGFGPDHLLYIAMGDGGGSNDAFHNGQNPASLLGKILRMNVDQATPGAEIWVMGVRNPWRNSFDGDSLYVADVGQGAREEVNVISATSTGLNLGWPIMEGSGCLGGGSCNSSGLTLPVYEYTHAEGCSITGGYVYRGTALPQLVGTYFFSDYCSGWVRSFRYTGSAVTELKTWEELGKVGNVTSFGVDAAGELYITTIDGSVLKVVAG